MIIAHNRIAAISTSGVRLLARLRQYDHLANPTEAAVPTEAYIDQPRSTGCSDPDPHVSHPGKMLDMVLLVQLGGRERTASEHASLLGKAGFRLMQVVPTKSAVSIVEAAAA